jgi:serine/threonine-protein kinase RsbW
LKTGKQDIIKNEYTIPASTDSLKDVREIIETACAKYKISKKTVYEITLAVDEACTNIIKHAYHNSSDKQINISLTVSEKLFEIKLTDTGEHFDPSKIPNPDIRESQKQKKGGGLGVFLMKKIMDEVKYKTIGNKNELTLIKKLM